MSTFTPDQRNIGGRSLISQQIWNHLQQLQLIHSASHQQVISPRRSPATSKPQSLEPVYKSSARKKQDYLLFPTFLFRRKTISENMSPSLSPKQNETQLLFQDPHLRKSSKTNKQHILPFSTVHLGQLQKIKASDVKQRKQESILWEEIEFEELSDDYDELLSQIHSIIQCHGIYRNEEYQRLISLILHHKPYISKANLVTIFNQLIMQQSLL